MKIKTVGIIGLGLIGGSIAKALKEKLNINVIGIDIDKNNIGQALSTNTIIKGSNDVSDVKDCDIVFICVPILESFDIILKIANIVKKGCIITDVGSTKSQIMNFVENKLGSNIIFIGGHPMAGSEKSGFSESKAHLFENAYYILTPSKNCSNSHINTLKKLIKAIGAIPLVLDPEQHDLITAAISHVPHVLASCLVNMINKLDNKENHMHKLAAGGFKDITRIASSNPFMWQNICFSNTKNICNIIDEYINMLNNFKTKLKNNSTKEIYNFFNNAKCYRDSFSNINSGPIQPLYNLFVDVEDKPGVIGKIATLLGNNNINIKNIGISNSREYQSGCLIISFNSKQDLVNALVLLRNNNYRVNE